MKELTIEERKRFLLEILKEFHDVCEKNNLTYYLAYGSLLGAVRHNGFIPWDDDVDVWMPLEDIEKLSRIQLNNYYFWDCTKDVDYPLSFGKFSKIGTLVKEETYSFSNIKLGLNIDIFPLCNGNRNIVKKNYKQYKLLSNNYKFKSYKPIKGDNMIKNILKNVLHISRFYVNFNSNANGIRNLLKKCNNNHIDCVHTMDEFENITFDVDTFDDRTKHKFENLDIYIPKRYHEILSSIYGDYMILPKNTESTHKMKSYLL